MDIVFIFHVTVGGSMAQATLQSVDYDDPTGIQNLVNVDPTSASQHIYNLQGQRLNVPQPGLNIINGQKIVVK